MGAWVPFSGVPGRLDDIVVKTTSEGTEIDREAILAVATETVGFTEAMTSNKKFNEATAKVSSLFLGGLPASQEVATLHTAAHRIVGDTLDGLRLDLDHFAVELRRSVDASDEADQLSEAELNRIAQIDPTHNADVRRGMSQNRNAPLPEVAPGAGA